MIDSFRSLAGPRFDPSDLHPAVVDFYERTEEWRLEAWSQWCAPAWPFGWMLSTVFARRLRTSSAFRYGPSTWPTEWTAGC